MKLFSSCMGSKNSRHSPNDKVRRPTPSSYTRVHQGEVPCIAAGSARHTIITGGSDGNATLFDYNSGKVLQYMRHGERPVTAVQSASVLRGVVTGCRDAKVRLWHNDNSTPIVFDNHALVVTAVVITPDNTRILSGSRDNCIKAWDVKTTKLLYSISESRNLITGMKLVPNESTLVQSSEDKRIRLWDTRNLQLVHVYPPKNYIQTSCDVSQNGNYIASGSNGFNRAGCEVNVWDIRQRALVCELRGHAQSVNCVGFIPDMSNSIVVSGSKDSVIRIWDVTRRECLIEKRLPGMGAVTGVVPFSDSSMICSTQHGCVLLTLSKPNVIDETIMF